MPGLMNEYICDSARDFGTYRICANALNKRPADASSMAGGLKLVRVIYIHTLLHASSEGSVQIYFTDRTVALDSDKTHCLARRRIAKKKQYLHNGRGTVEPSQTSQ